MITPNRLPRLAKFVVLTISADQKLAIEEGMQILASIDIIEPFVLVIGLASNL